MQSGNQSGTGITRNHHLLISEAAATGSHRSRCCCCKTRRRIYDGIARTLLTQFFTSFVVMKKTADSLSATRVSQISQTVKRNGNKTSLYDVTQYAILESVYSPEKKNDCYATEKQ
jgi:hypothetical protein